MDNTDESNFNKYNGTWLYLKSVGGIFPRVIIQEDGEIIKISYDHFNNFRIVRNDTLKAVAKHNIEDGVSKVETNFGESYTQPAQKITEDFVKVFASFQVKLSQAFKIRLMLDPDFESAFRIAQYWLEFEAKL